MSETDIFEYKKLQERPNNSYHNFSIIKNVIFKDIKQNHQTKALLLDIMFDESKILTSISNNITKDHHKIQCKLPLF